jgi:AraC family transcriptional regulator of adaptative response/methylated-DNA-[protein]-cysteine methyltransferase
VAAILFGRPPARLREELAQAFPNARRIDDAMALRATLAAAAALLDDPRTGFDAPLDLRGCERELAVWTALRAIPPGETRSYGELARALDLPATAQEVGAACAANVLAVAIPCHRVLKADGSLSGYRWGRHWKRWLLEREAAT